MVVKKLYLTAKEMIIKKNIITSIILFLFLSLGCQYDKHSAKYPMHIASSQNIKEAPNQISNKYMPVMGVWGWRAEELQPDGYKKSIDLISKNSPFNLIILFLRFPDKEIIDKEVHNQVKLATEYALQQNIAFVADIDVRQARQTFKELYPKDLQQMLRIKEISLSEKNSLTTTIQSIDLSDHYSGGEIINHIPLDSELLRVYSYNLKDKKIDTQTIREITDKCIVNYSSKDSIIITIPNSTDSNTTASVMCSFTHLYPDIFSPNLVEFQQKIIKDYGDIPLAGVCKDEWGFPPYQNYIFNPYPDSYHTDIHDFWFSNSMAQVYSDNTDGRDILFDFLLMSNSVIGKESERMMSINTFNEMVFKRNSDLETDFYHTVKETFGSNAAVTVHPTWWPYPESFEYIKNGLNWWSAKRDWAQTDEIVPFAVRTALSKKWNSPVWYNMYYQKGDLAEQIWSSVLAGGRICYLSYPILFDSKLMRAESRIRLLNYITESQLDSPVAVIFGHTSAMNWGKEYYDDVGMKLIDSLWHNGYPADLIPTSEIDNGSLYVDKNGNICYGSQKYEAVVLYHPEFEKKTTYEFFNKAIKGNTKMFRIGNWTQNFYGKSINGNSLLPSVMIQCSSIDEIVSKLLETLKRKNVFRHSSATYIISDKFKYLADFNHTSFAPATTGYCKLIDGTIIHTAGSNDVSGDTLKLNYEINGQNIMIDAIGVSAVRLDDQDNLQALAAGELKHFKVKDFQLNLDERVDIALWINSDGKWEGVIQQEKQTIPKELLAITKNWTLLNLPQPSSNK